MPDAIEVRKVPLHTVSDASELGRLIDDGVFDADRVVAVIGVRSVRIHTSILPSGKDPLYWGTP